MASRTFRGSDGADWTVWLVRPQYPGVAGTPTEWLAFQSHDGTERRRLTEFPDDWETLPDDRLDLMRRIATPAAPAGSTNRKSGEIVTDSWFRS